MGNSFRMYLRDTDFIQEKHLDILRAALQEVIDLIGADTEALISELATGLTNVELDNEMGKYEDNMDWILNCLFIIFRIPLQWAHEQYSLHLNNYFKKIDI